MLRLRKSQDDLWEAILPSEIFRLSNELCKVDEILSDERFYAPFIKGFSTNMGRPTIPVDTYLR
jgi:hypothetical protein